MKRITPLLALAAYVILAGAMVAGIWRVGDERCESARHYETLAGYGYRVTIDPCNEAWAMSVWEPALR